MKVRANSQYIYYPNFLDRSRPAHYLNLVPGDVVRVVNMHGCPPANTMGQCHVELNGQFAGMVSTNSLYQMCERQIVIDAIKADMEKLVVKAVR